MHDTVSVTPATPVLLTVTKEFSVTVDAATDPSPFVAVTGEGVTVTAGAVARSVAIGIVVVYEAPVQVLITQDRVTVMHGSVAVSDATGKVPTILEDGHPGRVQGTVTDVIAASSLEIGDDTLEL